MKKGNMENISGKFEIPKNFFHLKNVEALIVVTGRQDCIMFRASQGALEKIDGFKVSHPHYSDDEGFFESRVAGVGVIRSGSPKELRDEDTVIRDFIIEFKSHIKKINISEFEKIFLFCPSYMKNFVLKALPRPFKEKMAYIIYGNFYNDNFGTILKKLEEIEEKAREKPILNPESAKILNKIQHS